MKEKIKKRLYEIVFEADTTAGKAFDIALLIAILFSITLVMMHSVKSFNDKYAFYLHLAEWFVTVIFTAEYILRIYIVDKPLKYIFSFYGILDFLSVLPSYIGLIVPTKNGLAVIRSLRLLRIFRILNLSSYVAESSLIYRSLLASRKKIGVFLFAILLIVIIIGAVMYVVENEKSGFTSIPQSIYWAVVTLTTVGYGDIAPQTVTGKIVASIVMVLGYAIIAVPTGIVTSEFNKATKKNKKISNQVCEDCLAEGHDPDAVFCKYCGSKINK